MFLLNCTELLLIRFCVPCPQAFLLEYFIFSHESTDRTVNLYKALCIFLQSVYRILAHKMHSTDKILLRLESVCKLPIVPLL